VKLGVLIIEDNKYMQDFFAGMFAGDDRFGGIQENVPQKSRNFVKSHFNEKPLGRAGVPAAFCLREGCYA